METELYWQAVRANDARFDGSFVLGVRTTGIYCKPSCRARLPKRENVDFYRSPVDAESSGLRACKRCRPEANAEGDPRVAAVVRACEILDGEDQMTLGALAAAVGASASHLQRSFKQIVGVSPKRYLEAKQMERFKNEMRSGNDVTTAMYEAGFGSSRGLYEKASEQLGMTPKAYGKGGAGMQIVYAITPCELGLMLVGRTRRGICSVTFADSADDLVNGLTAEFPKAEIETDNGELKGAVDSILEYLAGREHRLILPLDLQATAFQLQVWDILQKIPFGETRSYTEVAEALGDRKKVRAVAQACARNRVALLIPCHRVVGADGSLSGYRWGIERKSRLLAAERES